MHNRPRRPNRAADRPSGAGASLTVVIFPGASLMDIRLVSDGIALVRCPACGGSQVFATGPTATIVPAVFLHERDDCPLLLRIESALARQRAALEAEQN